MREKISVLGIDIANWYGDAVYGSGIRLHKVALHSYERGHDVGTCN